MANLNRVQLIGRITHDPDSKFLPSGSCVTELRLAINRIYRDKDDQKCEEVTFCSVSYFGKQAETLREYVRKGDPIYLEARLKLDQWTDSESGKNRSTLKLIGESFQFLASKRDDSAHREQRKQETPPRRERPPAPPRDPDLDSQDDDSLPF